MTISVAHSTLSDASFSAEGAAAWDATHSLVGFGTAAASNTTDFATAAQGLPIGGTTSQFLAKSSNTDYAVNWSSSLVNPTVTNYTETPYSANTSTAITVDLANGTVQVLTLTGSPTITMPTAVAGKSFIIYLKTGAGGYSVTWTTVKWPSATAPTITATASKMDIYSFFSDGTNWYGCTVGQNYTP
jgi:hypothetical protein